MMEAFACAPVVASSSGAVVLRPAARSFACQHSSRPAETPIRQQQAREALPRSFAGAASTKVGFFQSDAFQGSIRSVLSACLQLSTRRSPAPSSQIVRAERDLSYGRYDITDPKKIGIRARLISTTFFMLPFVEGLMFGKYIFKEFPIWRGPLNVLSPIINIYFGFPLSSMFIFLGLYMLVVRNPKINHFIRFYAMQGMLCHIFLTIWGQVIRFVPKAIETGMTQKMMFNAIFLYMLSTCAHGIVCSLLGRYQEVDVVSDASRIHLMMSGPSGGY
eukprot:tig00020830_g14385.t1